MVGVLQILDRRVVGRILVEKRADSLAVVMGTLLVEDKLLVVVAGRNLGADKRLAGVVDKLVVVLNIRLKN